VSFAGVREAVRDQGDSLRSMAEERGLRVTEIENPDRVWRALQDFPWPVGDAGTSGAVVAWRGSVLPSDCGKAMQGVRDAASGCGGVAVAASASHGVLRGTLRASTADLAARGVSALRAALAALDGFLVVTDAPEALRTSLDVWGPMPPEVTWMRQIRSAFDAKAILNPGRFIDTM